ncbi:MAG: dTMP kinase [Chlorobiaceae bacterium]|nr:dTMP kinase [Chlorobiaceae bacterium]MBA4308987.1 dTMP kinase [Chlorobiaceae bacterium]
MFITFEGIDFCGKSTQVKMLKEFLLSQNKNVKIIREPGGTEISELIRNILLDKKNLMMSIESEIFLFSAARAQLVNEVIIPELNKGTFIISDRFHDSTTAYQGYGRGIPLDLVNQINLFAIAKRLPDLTFIIDITVDEGELRKQNTKGIELDRMEIEKLDFFRRVRNGYLQMAKDEKRFIVIDGSKSVEEIHSLIVEHIKNFIKEK